MNLARVAALAAACCAPAAAHGGDYGLQIDDRVGGCRSISHSNSACHSEAVAADLRGHFAEGRPYRIAAVRTGLAHCRVHFAGAVERNRIYDVLATLLTTEEVKHEDELLDTIVCFPFRGMRSRLESAILQDHAPAVRSRLHEARKRIRKRLEEVKG